MGTESFTPPILEVAGERRLGAKDKHNTWRIKSEAGMSSNEPCSDRLDDSME